MRRSKNNSISFKNFTLLIAFILALFLAFSQDFHSVQSDRSITFTFAGDAIPHYIIRSIIDSEQISSNQIYSLNSIFYFLKYYLNSDASFFNLETTISGNPQKVKPYHFSVQPVFLESLIENGFTHYTIANNHSLDYGENGFKKTLSYIDKTRCTGFFDQKISYITFNLKDFKVAFLSFTMLSNYPVDKKYKIKPVFVENPLRDKNLIDLIQVLDRESDILIVGVHWGQEYKLQPDDLQRKVAKFLIDNGVDIIWGTHPHVIEPFEIYNGKLILYSCANLVSGQAYNISSKDQSSFHPNYFYTRSIPIIKVSINGNKSIKNIELIPFFQLNNYFVRKSNEKYFTTLIPTKYFMKKGNLQNIFHIFLNGHQRFLELFDYIKNNLLSETEIKNIKNANDILFNTFFSKMSENKFKIIEKEDSYIIEF